MDDFDIFSNEINFTKASYKNLLENLVYDAPSTPNTCNYQSGRKLLAAQCLADSDEAQCTFHLSEAVAASIRISAMYREEQRKIASNKHKIPFFSEKHEQDLINGNVISKNDQILMKHLTCDTKTMTITESLKQCEIKEEPSLHRQYSSLKNDQTMLEHLIGDKMLTITESLKQCEIKEDPSLHRRYLRFTTENNIHNFHTILKELPKEWTVVQLTAPYNPNENFKRLSEYQNEIDSIYLSVFTNDYMDQCELTPFSVNIHANVTKEGLKPLFVELHSLLQENYKTLENAQYKNTKKQVKNYWDSREEVDLRMKSVINLMDKQWLGGWGALLTGRLLDQSLKRKVVQVVDEAIADWGFVNLTAKQKLLLYKLIENCPNMVSQQIKSCIRKILTENGNIAQIRQVLEPCANCTKDFALVNELCFKCLSNCFEKIHHFGLIDGIRAFSKVATLVRDSEVFAPLKNAERHPVILIVDELLDTFPWESLPILIQHPVSRIENIHFLYYLYKQHESDVINGYFNTRGHDGRYVINPEKNLERMERRMDSFVQYWCSQWQGYIAEPPPPELFIDYLTTADIFLYCGHGDGCQFAQCGGGAGVESARGARAVCVLSGCGSARLVLGPGREPPTAAHMRLHTAGCPAVVGMLWEVTDLEVDKVVTSLVSLCVPSNARVPWSAVEKEKWSQGILDTKVESTSNFVCEPDLLRAIVRSRGSSNFVMIGSSMVSRGLPVKIR